MLIAYIYFTTRQKWAQVLKKKYPENENYYRNWNIMTDPCLKSPRNGFFTKKDKIGPPPEKFTENENYYRNQNITTEPYQKSPRNGFLQKKKEKWAQPLKWFLSHHTKWAQSQKWILSHHAKWAHRP